MLIGENNSGKTAVLDVLRLCLRDLGPRRRVVFDAFDFHLRDAAAEPSSADPIRVEVTFSEDAKGDWGDELIGRLNRQKILQVREDERSHVLLRVTCAYNVMDRDFVQEWAFLNLDRQPLTGISENALGTLQREVAYFYLAALRDAAHHFDAKGPFWRPFLKDSQLPAEKKAEIEQKLREVNDIVVASHTSFEQARNGLRKLQDVVPLASGDVVRLRRSRGACSTCSRRPRSTGNFYRSEDPRRTPWRGDPEPRGADALFGLSRSVAEGGSDRGARGA